MPITRVKLENFTAFRSLDFAPGPGVNVLIGANGTGKTHLLKAIYAACEAAKTKEDLIDVLTAYFMPYQGQGKRLRHNGAAPDEETRLEVQCGDGCAIEERIPADYDPQSPRGIDVSLPWQTPRVPRCTYIPAKEMLANAPGFRSLYSERLVHFEQCYVDIVDRAYLPPLRVLPGTYPELVAQIEAAIGGKVRLLGEEFFLDLGNGRGQLEFALLSEGWRKLALLGLLIQNGTVSGGSVLLWDEPEANLNPASIGLVVDILLALQRAGVQVFLATHEYVLLKEFDLRTEPTDAVMFHALYRDQTLGDVSINSTGDYLQIGPSAISDTFTDLYDRDVTRALGGGVRQ